MQSSITPYKNQYIGCLQNLFLNSEQVRRSKQKGTFYFSSTNKTAILYIVYTLVQQ